MSAEFAKLDAMIGNRGLTRRRVIEGTGLLAATFWVALPATIALAHEGHDYAPRTILDLKGKLARIVGPNETVGDEFIADRVTICVNTAGRIVELTYG